MYRYRGMVVAAALFLSPAAVAQNAPAPATDQPAQPAATDVHVDGFRSAKWGMTDAQVKDAIHKDFNIAPDKVKADENLSERTTVLTITVPDLLESTGAARVSYIFGYTSKKLIQVNVLWGEAVDPQTSPEKIVAAANELRQLFIDAGYQPNSIMTNTKMPDGSVLVFKGQDTDKHTTLLRLAAGTVSPATAKGTDAKPVETAALSLSYILDPSSPDIYRIKKGLF
jgi:hypothetical protein